MFIDHKSKIIVDELNEVYYRIVDLIGLDDAINLSKNLAGRQIRFNKKYDLDYDYPEIIECIGKAKAKKLIQAFLGESVYFSGMKKFLRSQIRAEFTGYNYKELAFKYGYTERSIRRIVASK